MIYALFNCIFHDINFYSASLQSKNYNILTCKIILSKYTMSFGFDAYIN